ncbi:P2X purinoceptor 3 isoform X2 [Onychostruthus taczanowskii]|uniref:P2X purinoceptor 3 isoform X2 n=1 Tax=Onychostruthus taczanowskii TaxID=356909 RepID=UPI001B80C4A4|nr:P2X purinoceptor 3 isoform X2 [Onychostruthus taczanowskii]
MDTADYVTPPQGTSVFVVVTKQIRTEDQAQGVCPESEAAFHCSADRDCRELSPGTSNAPSCWKLRTSPSSSRTASASRSLALRRPTCHPLAVGRSWAGVASTHSCSPCAPSCAWGTWHVWLGRTSLRWLPPGGCWGSRSGGCVTWTGPGSAACPATPSPAWTAWPGPLPLDTTSGTPGTTAGLMAPSAAPSSRPSGSALMSWCMAVPGSSASSPPSSTRWLLSPPSVWARCCATSSCSTSSRALSTTRPASSRRCQRPACPPPPQRVPPERWGPAPGTSNPPTRAPSPSASSPGGHGAAPRLCTPLWGSPRPAEGLAGTPVRLPLPAQSPVLPL